MIASSRPSCGGVDWNKIFDNMRFIDVSRPSRGGVDWNIKTGRIESADGVAPRVGAWIETH